jgi:hypothetical protein
MTDPTPIPQPRTADSSQAIERVADTGRMIERRAVAERIRDAVQFASAHKLSHQSVAVADLVILLRESALANLDLAAREGK